MPAGAEFLAPEAGRVIHPRHHQGHAPACDQVPTQKGQIPPVSVHEVHLSAVKDGLLILEVHVHSPPLGKLVQVMQVRLERFDIGMRPAAC